MSSSYEPTSATAGHAATAAPRQAVPETVSDVRRERCRDAQPEQPPRQRRNGAFRRAQSSITIELA